jgi:hypothetical protein
MHESDGAYAAGDSQRANGHDACQEFYRTAVAEALGRDRYLADQALAVAKSKANSHSQTGERPGGADQQGQIEWLIRAHVSIARRLSSLLDRPASELVPPTAATGNGKELSTAKTEALEIGTAVQRSIRRTITECWTAGLREMVDEIRSFLSEHITDTIPDRSRWLNTTAIAKRLSLAPKTVRKLCGQGLIDAQKTAGGEWRTTEDKLRGSRYLLGRKHRRINPTSK